MKLFTAGLSAIALVTTVAIEFPAQAQASSCWDYYELGNRYVSGIEYVRACQYARQQRLLRELEQVSTPAPTNQYRIDNNANVRSGASGTSGVMLQTTSTSIVTVHSWGGENNDWAWITLPDGTNGWTHQVNLTKL